MAPAAAASLTSFKSVNAQQHLLELQPLMYSSEDSAAIDFRNLAIGNAETAVLVGHPEYCCGSFMPSNEGIM